MSTNRSEPLRTILLRIREAAEQLRVSERTIWALIAAGRLTPIRLGRRATRLAADELDRLVAEARRQAERAS